jgi:hypothetical protein
MGLHTVEIVLRTEELFAMTIDDEEARLSESQLRRMLGFKAASTSTPSSPTATSLNYAIEDWENDK